MKPASAQPAQVLASAPKAGATLAFEALGQVCLGTYAQLPDNQLNPGQHSQALTAVATASGEPQRTLESQRCFEGRGAFHGVFFFNHKVQHLVTNVSF